jgi:uncharacterized repeat protein (TIGR01451 family)
VKPGDRLAYVVDVQNSGTTAVPDLKITQTLPRGLEFIAASSHGVAAAGTVTWHAGLPPGRSISFNVTAQVTQAPPGVLRLAAVACAAVNGGQPLVCASHLDQLPAAAAAQAHRGADAAGGTTLAYAAAALAVLAALTAGGLLVIGRRRSWLRRRLRRSA